MNRTRLMLIGLIALALGGFVSLLVYKNLQSKQQSTDQAGVDVVVAATDLQVGAKIEDGEVKLVRIPELAVPPNCFRGSMAKVIGRGVILPISKGEFILQNKLAGENTGSGLPSLIPPGMRAVSVRVNEVVSVAGFVQPGTRVDVLLTGSPGNGEGAEQTTTVLENVAVIATGQKLEHNTSGDAQMTPVITLLVSPDDAQKLTLASAQGRIQLALRNPLDTREQDLTAVNTNNLYKVAPAPAPSTAPHPKLKHTTQAPAPAPPPYQVDVIKGDKIEHKDF
ncbi:MAG TPA: Flp pilus assembly protein CpaB [Terriglobales bacterium]|nr:Flp pilus assembly protein CpaB [Terriglobales bacterium]